MGGVAVPACLTFSICLSDPVCGRSIDISTYLPICLPIYPSIYLSVYLPCLRIKLPIRLNFYSINPGVPAALVTPFRLLLFVHIQIGVLLLALLLLLLLPVFCVTGTTRTTIHYYPCYHSYHYCEWRNDDCTNAPIATTAAILLGDRMKAISPRFPEQAT